MIGDVTLTKDFGSILVIVTATDQQMEPGVVDEYLQDGYTILRDEREAEEE